MAGQNQSRTLWMSSQRHFRLERRDSKIDQRNELTLGQNSQRSAQGDYFDHGFHSQSVQPQLGFWLASRSHQDSGSSSETAQLRPFQPVQHCRIMLAGRPEKSDPGPREPAASQPAVESQ